MREALQWSCDLFGNDATLLIDAFLPSSMIEICESNGKKKGGPWECYNAEDFFGWEADQVVAVTCGVSFTLEMATRTKTRLILVAAEGEWKADMKFYARYQKYFQDSANKGLLELLSKN